MGDSNNSSSRRICRHDVFLSFRGTDTRNTFTDHLYHHLIRKGIFAFKDDQSLQQGESISPQLQQAIKDSRVSVVVFSRDYAASTWCLDEMATIAECRKDLEQAVFPIFYNVDPSHVRRQNGVYEDAFFSHTEKFEHDPDKVDRWKRAMTDLANLAGFDVRNMQEVTKIEEIVKAVIKKLGHRFSGFTNDLVGIQPRVDELVKLLKLDSEDDNFRVFGIWGMGGIGKTTHATVLYDRIFNRFDARCFIDNVSKIYRVGGAVAVQKQILRQVLDEKNLDTYSTCEISGIITNRLHSGIKVLLVLDDVDQLEQLLELAIYPKSLCKGSRIIITTRDEHILGVYGADEVHKVPLLNDNDAREFFYRKAFKSEGQSSSYVELIPEVLKYVQNLPLAIRVMGSFLYNRDATQWRAALKRLRNNLHNKIMEVLRISFDGLNSDCKEIFLHIACFFKGEREDYVKRILDCCGLHPDIGIPLITEKSLITVRNQEIHMHELLQELGKEIVRHQFPEEPGSWSRLWKTKDFHHVLMAETGANNVKAIVLDQKEDVFKCRAEGFANLSKLRLLILYHNNFSGNLNFLSNSLQYLSWHGYPFTSLPSNFEPSCLVELNMANSSIQRLWEGRKDLPFLKRMDLSNSKYLIETPSFFGTPKLQRLDFTGCTELSQVHSSIGLLTELAFLSLQDCSRLVSLDFGCASNLSSLRVLCVSGCTKLEKTLNFFGASNLQRLDMDRCTSLSMVHESIGALAKLRFLSFRDCTNLVRIPNSVNTMTSLETLVLCGCSQLTTLPLELTLKSSSVLKSLIFLNLSFCNLRKVPDAIGELKCLERLNLQGNNFDSLPLTILMLESLAYLNLAHCHELQTFPKLPSQNASLVGRYFKTESGCRDHRSGLYIFDCPKMKGSPIGCLYSINDIRQWLLRLVKKPRHFRCGFDIIVPWDWETNHSMGLIPLWFEHQFDGGSIIRMVQFNVDDNWLGFAFCVAFEVNNCPANSGSPHDSFSSPLPHPFYLSFESEDTEEYFDMPLSLELDKIDGSKHLWVIYISREHCHFVKTGSHITFKACSGLIIKKWGLHIQTNGEKDSIIVAEVVTSLQLQQQQQLQLQQKEQQLQQKEQQLEQQEQLLEQQKQLLKQLVEEEQQLLEEEEEQQQQLEEEEEQLLLLEEEEEQPQPLLQQESRLRQLISQQLLQRQQLLQQWEEQLEQRRQRRRQQQQQWRQQQQQQWQQLQQRRELLQQRQQQQQLRLVFDYVNESSSSSGPKIQLPYNWLVTEEEEVENFEAKSKENDLSNMGF